MSGGLIALFVISAVVMIFICIVGILGACHICHPILLIMWLIGCAILIIVIVIQIILNATLQCNAPNGSPQRYALLFYFYFHFFIYLFLLSHSIVCGGTYAPVSWAGLGVTLGLATLGFIFGIILMKIYYDDDHGTDGCCGGGGSGDKVKKAQGDFNY